MSRARCPTYGVVMSPRWGFGVLVFYTHIAPLGLQLLLYTLHPSGARGLDLSPSYRHIAPLERKIEDLTDGGDPAPTSI